MSSPSATRRTIRILERDVDLAAGLPAADVARATAELVAPVFEPDWDERGGQWGIGDRGLGLLLMVIDPLAMTVGAARPSVTTALGRLAERGDVVRSQGGWRLDPASRATVSNLTD